MPEKLEEILDKEITIEDIAKMGLWEKCKYYASEGVFNVVRWPGFIGGPVGTFASVAISSRYSDSFSKDVDYSIPFILGTFLGGAMIASAMRVGYHIARDYSKIKKIKNGAYESKKARG